MTHFVKYKHNRSMVCPIPNYKEDWSWTDIYGRSCIVKGQTELLNWSYIVSYEIYSPVITPAPQFMVDALILADKNKWKEEIKSLLDESYQSNSAITEVSCLRTAVRKLLEHF